MARFYVATGTGKYQDSELDLPTVETDLKNISAALEAVSFTKADPSPPLNPAGEDLRALRDWFDKRSPEDDVVLYYVGHGKSDDQHYLILQREDFASLDLVRTFARNPVARRILLVLDTCESGNASLDLAELWKSFEERFRETGVYLFFLPPHSVTPGPASFHAACGGTKKRTNKLARCTPSSRRGSNSMSSHIARKWEKGKERVRRVKGIYREYKERRPRLGQRTLKQSRRNSTYNSLAHPCDATGNVAVSDLTSGRVEDIRVAIHLLIQRLLPARPRRSLPNTPC